MTTKQYLPFTEIDVTLNGRPTHDTQVYKELKLSKGTYKITFLDKLEEGSRLSFWDGNSMNVMIYYDCDEYVEATKVSMSENTFSESMLLKAIAAATNSDRVIGVLA